MHRRVVVVALAAALSQSVMRGARAQATTAVRRIGALGVGPAPLPSALKSAWAPARELGWTEGQNLIVERRYVAREELLQQAAEELVRLKVELIITNGTAATRAAKSATSRIPIVILWAGDPVATGMVASLARPGGNVTGFAGSFGLDAKRLELLHELLPAARRIGVLSGPGVPRARAETGNPAYGVLGLQPIVIAVDSALDVKAAMIEARRQAVDALVMHDSGPFYNDPAVIAQAAIENRLALFVGDDEYVEAGALLSVAVDSDEQYRVLVAIVDKILRGAKPADIPVQQPSRFPVSINLRTARVVGVAVPAAILQRAGRVVE